MEGFMRPLWKRIQGTAIGLWGVLRRIPAEKWGRMVVVGVMLLEAVLLLPSSNVPPMDTGEVFGEIHWYKG